MQAPPRFGSRRAVLMRLTCALFPALTQSASRAQIYPAGPIRLIVPFPPAGGTDVLSRHLAQTVTEMRGWNFVVENRPGVGGNLGLEMLARSRADGLTLAMGQTSNLAINPALFRKMPYDAMKDFTPVALVASQPTVLVVRESAAYRRLSDLIAHGKAAKAKGGLLTMASPGVGTVGHLAGELFARRAGLEFTHVPYKGAAPALSDVMAGQVDLNFATPTSAMPLIRAGKLRALAVTSAERLYALPEVPTVAESGFKGFVAEDWKALLAPAGTPPAVVQTLSEAVNAALGKGEMRARLALDGSRPLGGSPAQLALFMRGEHARWAEAVQLSGASAE